jgi:hypothetical protein
MAAAERARITTISTADLPALEAQLREETARRGAVLTSPLIVSASCRLRSSTSVVRQARARISGTATPTAG